jgi:hypothetical protein
MLHAASYMLLTVPSQRLPFRGLCASLANNLHHLYSLTLTENFLYRYVSHRVPETEDSVENGIFKANVLEHS